VRRRPARLARRQHARGQRALGHAIASRLLRAADACSRVPPAAAPSVKGDVLRTGFELTHEPRP
jgi:hypothetical protein